MEESLRSDQIKMHISRVHNTLISECEQHPAKAVYARLYGPSAIFDLTFETKLEAITRAPSAQEHPRIKEAALY